MDSRDPEPRLPDDLKLLSTTTSFRRVQDIVRRDPFEPGSIKRQRDTRVSRRAFLFDAVNIRTVPRDGSSSVLRNAFDAAGFNLSASSMTATFFFASNGVSESVSCSFRICVIFISEVSFPRSII